MQICQISTDVALFFEVAYSNTCSKDIGLKAKQMRLQTDLKHSF